MSNQTKNPLVSVIIPAYNCENIVLESIKSVINQSYENWEMIIVDDFSTDNTFDTINDFIKDFSNIKLIKNAFNSGVAITRNNGINIASGEYIAFLDSDDIWLPTKISKQIKLIQSKNAKMVYSSYSFIDEMGKALDKSYIVPEKTSYVELLKQNVIGNSTVLIKSDFLGKSPYSSEYFHEDFVLSLRLLKKVDFAYGLKEVLVLYRTGGRSTDKIQAAKNRWLIYRKSENLGFFSSLKYLFVYAINGIKKHY